MTTTNPNTAPPTLFALTAPAPRQRDERPAETGFAEELSAAASEPKVQNRSQDEASSEAPKRSDSVERSPASEEKPDDSHNGEATDESSTVEVIDQPVEAGLLSVTTAVETLVVETRPDAVLPDEAATIVDVGAVELGSLSQRQLETQPRISEFVPTPTAEKPSIEPIASAVTTPTAASETIALTPQQAKTADQTDIDQTGSVSPVGAEAIGHKATVATDSASGVAAEAGDALKPGNPAAADKSPTTDGVSTPEAATEFSQDEGSDHKPQASATSELAPPTEPKNESASTESAPREPAQPNAGLSGVQRVEQAETPQVTRSEQGPAIDPTRFVNRVSRAIESAAERGRPIEIRLSPPELGSLRVTIELKEGVMTAALETETPAARTTLLDNLPALRDRLEQQQIRIEKFDVDVRDESGQRGGDWQPSEGREGRSEERSDHREPDARPLAEPTTLEGQTDADAPSTIFFNDRRINFVA